MARLTDVARRAPLATFFTLAFAFTWALLPFAGASVAISLVALCGPAAAAFATAALAGGDEWRALLARLTAWRVSPRWYLHAALLPLPITAFASALEYAWGADGAIRLHPLSALTAVLFVLVAGEEIGWRGFALPRLLARFGPWMASAVLGTLWALWHYPLFRMEGMPQHGSPFPAFVIYTIALSVILTFLALNTRGSVVIATLFHGAVNTFAVINTAATPTQRGWGNAVAYGLAAVSIGLTAWRASDRRSGTA